MKKPFKYLIIIVIFCFHSCDYQNGFGPCIHTYEEPILHITAIRDTVNNVNIRFVLRELKINNSMQYGAYHMIPSYSMVSDDSIFYCNVPFGFGVENGKYQFIIEAEGYQPKHFTIESVDYSVFKGGCPSYNDGGKRITLYLD
jgi:hypothetical protein